MRGVHFAGIGGIHMSALAHILLDDGETVSGCDRTDSPLIGELRARGAEIAIGHDPAHVADASRVIRTVAIPADHPEIAAAARAGLDVLTRAELLREVAAPRRVIAVSGSHGKSTTTAMLTCAMRAGGRDAGYVLGAEVPGISPHARRGTDDWLALEADEYGRAFHHYEPEVAVITNVEPDHLDYYGDFEALRDAFLQYALTLREGGALVYDAAARCARATAERAAAERADIRLVPAALAGDSAPAAWTAECVSTAGARTSFTIAGPGVRLRAELGAPGEFNVRNALLAVAAATAAGFDPADAVRGIADFGGVLVVDDYAHHPTEVAATITAARERFAGRRLIVLFQPHTYSRSQYLLAGFRACFSGADRLLIADTYAAREEPRQGLDAERLATEIAEPRARYAGPVTDSARAAAEVAEPGDVVITMGAGDIEAAGPLILSRLRERRS